MDPALMLVGRQKVLLENCKVMWKCSLLCRKMSRAGGKAGNLRDKLDGNELDLSLSDLSEIPVRDLVSYMERTLQRKRPQTSNTPGTLLLIHAQQGLYLGTFFFFKHSVVGTP